MRTQIAFFAASLIAMASSGGVLVLDEGFESLAFGDTTGINQSITDGSYDAGLRLHNHLVGKVVAPAAGFNTASGNAFQLTTGTNPDGGWGILSADNSPRSVSLTEGEQLVLSFDMYVQAVPAGSSGLELQLVLTGGDDVSRTFTELSGASVGDVVHVSWTNTVTAGMASATAISPRIGVEGYKQNFENPGTDVDVVQIDHLQLEAGASPTTSVYYLDADNGSNGNTGTSPGQAWAGLSKASSVTFNAGDQILLQCGDTFVGKLVLDDDNGTAQNPIVVASYGTGGKPVINAAGYRAGVHIENSDYIEVRDLEITADGGAPVDGSNAKQRYGVLINTTSANAVNGVTLSNLYVHTIYPYQPTDSEGTNPTTYMGFAFDVKGQSSNPSDNIVIEGCRIENTGHKVLGLSRANHVQVLNNHMENIGGPAMVPNRCDDLVVRGNVVDRSGAYTDPRMHGRGSGIWPIHCNRVLIEQNAFMHARGRYDSCGAHIDIGNTDVVIQHNLSMDNEGGFVEILGENQNCSYRYNISINDGARRSGTNESGLSVGDGHVIIFSGHNGTTNRVGPSNSYIYNNTVYVKEGQHCSFSIEDPSGGILVANNLFFIDGEAEDGTASWFANHPAGIEDRVVWTNNLYQRGGVFPEDWIFYEGNPIYGNPNLANPGGLTAEDYMPLPGAFVEGRGIDIPLIPGDTQGLLIGLTVSNDFFGNPIQGLPDIGAVEVGGGVSTVSGSAFQGFPIIGNDKSAVMAAVTGPAGAEYYFEETTGNYGGTDSGWQTDTNYTDGGLLPNTPYSYTVTIRDALDVVGARSVMENVTLPSTTPFSDYVILDEDFSSRPDPVNAAAPFPVSTFYLDSADSWSSEGQDSSVVAQSDERLQLGYGYDEVLLQYCSDQTWDVTRDYELSGDWKIETIFSNNYGVIVGFAEHDPSSGALLQRIKEAAVGELVSPIAGQTAPFSLSVSAAELQAAGVSPGSRVGLFLHRDDDGVLYSQGSPKSDMYSIDNLQLLLLGDDVDTDSDGIPDAAETAVGLNPADPADGAGDLDLDGQLNNQEYLIGTDMNGTNAAFAIAAEMGGVIVPEPWILADRIYILEQKSTLQTSNDWKPVDAASGTLEAGKGDFAFPQTNSETQSFYRVRVEWE